MAYLRHTAGWSPAADPRSSVPREPAGQSIETTPRAVPARSARRFARAVSSPAITEGRGRCLQFHPHVHCVVPGGGLGPEHDRWIASRPRFFLPVKVLSRRFRLHTLPPKFRKIHYFGFLAACQRRKRLRLCRALLGMSEPVPALRNLPLGRRGRTASRSPERLVECVEIDETYIGGKRRNMSNARRKELAGTGRGAVGKSAVIGVKDRSTNRVVAQPVESVKKQTVNAMLGETLAPAARAYTDDSAVYEGLAQRETGNHSVSEFVRGMAHTNRIESFWSMLKRGYQGTYHKMSAKHLGRYVNEFSGHHNVRMADTLDQMELTLSRMVRKRLCSPW